MSDGPKGRRVSAVGLVWYHEATYQAAKGRMADGDSLPDTFQQWLNRASQREKEVNSAGTATVRVYVDTDEFPTFCRARGLHLDAHGRNQFAAAKAAEMVRSNTGGQG